MSRAEVDLAWHPDSPVLAVEWINVHFECTPQSHGPGSDIHLTYVIDGPTKRLRLPGPEKPRRADGLWQTTCVEMFVQRDGEYLEFNFSPSSQWAAYHFAGYREGMAPIELDTPPSVSCYDEGTELIVSVSLYIPWQPPFSIGLSAVVEEVDGPKSYWALAHPPGKPDFHDPACFALEVPAPRLP